MPKKMKTYSFTDKLPDLLPMTPPDEAHEPDLSDAMPCLCGYMPTWEFKPWSQCRLRCNSNCVIAWWTDNLVEAIDDWNYCVEEAKGQRLKEEGQLPPTQRTKPSAQDSEHR